LPPILGVLNATTQWLFSFPGRVSVTISAGDRLIDSPREELAATIWSEVARVTGCRRRFRHGKSCASAAPPLRLRRRKTPSARARQPVGPICSSPAIGQIRGCPLPSRVRSDQAIAPLR
jgi:hypothetical protein